MKVRVMYTVVVDDEQRKLIADQYGYGQNARGLATADAVRSFLEMHGTGGLDSLSPREDEGTNCCPRARASSGWHHNEGCKNWVLVF